MLREEPIISFSSEGTEDNVNKTAVFWTKIVFIILVIAEAAIAGMIPTWSPSCRENPKILGIANSFAGGVFLAIALMHITPEMIETWNGLPLNNHEENGEMVENEKIFPLPELLIFLGYTIILIIDKVLFDTHALFADEHGHHHDPAEAKMEHNVKASFAKGQAMAAGSNDPAVLKRSMAE